ncbi:MAG: alkaline phosphatase D family protein, partial [Pseudomonadota bacterium]
MGIPDDYRDRVRGPLESILQNIVRPSGTLKDRVSDNGGISFPSGCIDRYGATLVFGSCQYAAGLLDADLTHHAWRTLRRRLESEENRLNADLLLLLGDQVYVDATAGLFDPAAVNDRYVRPYWKWLADDDVQGVLARLPTYMMLDDHELVNDWQPESHGVASDP